MPLFSLSFKLSKASNAEPHIVHKSVAMRLKIKGRIAVFCSGFLSVHNHKGEEEGCCYSKSSSYPLTLRLRVMHSVNLSNLELEAIHILTDYFSFLGSNRSFPNGAFGTSP